MILLLPYISHFLPFIQLFNIQITDQTFQVSDERASLLERSKACAAIALQRLRSFIPEAAICS